MDKKSTFILAINRRAGGAYYIQQQQQYWSKSRSEWQTNGTVNNGTVNNGTVNKYCIISLEKMSRLLRSLLRFFTLYSSIYLSLLVLQYCKIREQRVYPSPSLQSLDTITITTNRLSSSACLAKSASCRGGWSVTRKVMIAWNLNQ